MKNLWWRIKALGAILFRGWPEPEAYPCRCGKTHRGPYALYDYAHHNCFHDGNLVRLDDNVAIDGREGWTYAICPQCGEIFWIEPAKMETQEETKLA